MKFRPGNEYLYCKDFRVYRGIPAGIDWQIRKNGKEYTLTAPGYGIAGDYGNGALHVYPKTRFQSRRLENAVTK